MKHFGISHIQSRVHFLQEIIKKAEMENQKLPQGSIRVVPHRKTYQYYLRTEESGTQGKYMRQDTWGIVRKIFQRDYNEKIIRVAKLEEKILTKLCKLYQTETVEDVYSNMPEGKRIQVRPISETEEAFLTRWLNMEHGTLPFDENATSYYSNAGVRVRSKSEIIIANLLEYYQIPYLYEMKLTLKNHSVRYPDFTLIDAKRHRVIFWEHLGLLDDSNYVNNALTKFKKYQENGLFLGEHIIITGENSEQPLDIVKMRELLEHYFPEINSSHTE